jgi:hypothetical protein
MVFVDVTLIFSLHFQQPWNSRAVSLPSSLKIRPLEASMECSLSLKSSAFDPTKPASFPSMVFDTWRIFVSLSMLPLDLLMIVEAVLAVPPLPAAALIH